MGDPNRILMNGTKVTFELCIEFMITHKTFYPGDLHAHPRIVLATFDLDSNLFPILSATIMFP